MITIREMTEEDIIFVKKLIESGVFLLIIIALLWGIYGGSQKGSDFFQMAEVHFVHDLTDLRRHDCH